MIDILHNFTLDRIESLRNLSLTGVSENNQHFSQDVYFSWDNEQAEVNINLHSMPGDLFSLEAEIYGTPRWITLNFALGIGSLASGCTLCLVMDAMSSFPIDLPIFVRSRVGEHLEDIHWDELVGLRNQREVAVALCTVPSTNATANDAFHTLIIQLPPKSFGMSLRDLRLFTIYSDDSELKPPTTLSSIA